MREFLAVLVRYQKGFTRIAVIAALAAFVFASIHEGAWQRLEQAINATTTLSSRDASARRAGVPGPTELSQMEPAEYERLAQQRREEAQTTCRAERERNSAPTSVTSEEGLWGSDPLPATCEELFESGGSVEAEVALVSDMHLAQASALAALWQVVLTSLLTPLVGVFAIAVAIWLFAPFARPK